MKTILIILIFTYFSGYAQKSDQVKPVPEKGYPFFLMNTERRDKIKNPADGMFIYNTDTKCLNYFTTKWIELNTEKLKHIWFENKNTFLGIDAGLLELSPYNTYLGDKAARFWRSRYGGNTVVGSFAGGGDTVTGNNNVILGTWTANEMKGDANRNTVVGAIAGHDMNQASDNTLYGFSAAYYNEGGNGNTAIGSNALYGTTTATDKYYNTALGYMAGGKNDGDSNLFLGAFADGAGSNKFVVANSPDRSLIYGDFLTGSIVIGKESIEKSARLEVNSTDKGFLMPRMTTQQRDAIRDPATGLCVFNIETKCLNFFIGSQWNEVCGTCTPKPTQANAGSDIIKHNDSTVTLNANIPGTGEAGRWSKFSALWGRFSDSTKYNTTFTGNLGNTYTLLWTITNKCGSSSDDVRVTFNFGIPCPGLDSFLYVGQWYHTVLIGSQCWMKENMNVGVMIESDKTPGNNGYIEKYCYDNNPANCDIYGGIYWWNEMMNYNPVEGSQGICATGWHVPTRAEWETLISYLSGASIAGGKMKERGNVHWYTPNTAGKNETGFTGLPGGFMNYYRESFNKGTHVWFWSSRWSSAFNVHYVSLQYNGENIYNASTYDTYGLYLRCIKD